MVKYDRVMIMEEVSSPLKHEIKIDFCRDKKRIYLSSPISSAISPSVRTYVEARKNQTFKPHATSFQIDGDHVVRVTQEIPFHWGHQPHIRQQMAQFWRLVKRCHQTLLEIAIEEKRTAAQ